MANITYLIGNGFDLNLGLKSSYTDFYKYYIGSKKVDEHSDVRFKEFCKNIASNYKKWSDFEIAFADTITGSKDDVRDILYFFSVEFLDYLKTRIELCDYTNKKISSEFIAFLTNHYKFLETRDRNILSTKYNNLLSTNNINTVFVNFNYTDTLKKVIDVFAREKAGTDKIIGRSSNHINQIGRILHIHGTLDDNIIIAADSLEQFSDENIRNNPAMAKYCVKSEINKDIGNSSAEDDYVKIINGSEIIYAYGISFGKSDKSRWNVINKWLHNNKEHKLVIYKYEAHFDKYNKIYRRKLLDAIEDTKNEFLKLLDFKEEEYEKFYDQIFIIDSANVLKFKLIEEAVKSEPDLATV